MRTTGLLHPMDMGPVSPDQVQTIAATTTPQAFDMPTSTLGTSAGMLLIQTSVGVYFNAVSTQANSVSSGTTTSSNQNEFFPPGAWWRQLVGGSTGYSVQSSTAGGGPMSVSYFKK